MISYLSNHDRAELLVKSYMPGEYGGMWNEVDVREAIKKDVPIILAYNDLRLEKVIYLPDEVYDEMFANYNKCKEEAENALRRLSFVFTDYDMRKYVNGTMSSVTNHKLTVCTAAEEPTIEFDIDKGKIIITYAGETYEKNIPTEYLELMRKVVDNNQSDG